MSSELFLEIKKHKLAIKNFNFDMLSTPQELEDNIGILELLNIPLSISFSPKSEKSEKVDSDNDTKKRSYSCKLKEIYDIDEIEDYFNKIKLKDWLITNDDKNKKIEEEIFILLKEIFDKRYDLYPNNVCSLSEYSNHIKNKVEKYCTKSKEMSMYILHMLYHQFYKLFKYVDTIVFFEKISLEDYQSLKGIIYHMGKDIKKIFKNATMSLVNNLNIKFSNIIMYMLEDFLEKENKLKDKPQMMLNMFSNEKKFFFNSIINISNIKYSNNIEKWLNDPGNINFENKKINISSKKNEKNNINNNENINDNLNNIIKGKNISELKEKNNNKIILNISCDNNKITGEKNKNEGGNNSEKNNEEVNDVHKLNIEELVNYINESQSKNNKKKAKRKKKTKKDNNNNYQENNNNNIKEYNNNYLDEDYDIINFKKSIEECANNFFLYPKKIEPNLSEAFYKKLENYQE